MSLVWTQLSDPLLYLQHSPFVAWAVVQSLVAIWAAESRAHWFWRWLGVIGAVTLMVPARAWEPAWLFALSSPLIVLLLKLEAWWNRRQAVEGGAGDSRHERRPLRFNLRDLFLITVIIASALPGIVELARHFKPFNAFGWLASSVGMAVIAVGGYRVVHRSCHRLAALQLMIAIPVCAAAVWCAGDWTKMWDLFRIWGSFTLDVATLMAMETQFALLLIIILTLTAALRSSTLTRPRRALAAGALAITVISVFGWAVLFYVQLLEPIPQRPPKFIAEPNHYDRILAIATRINVINKKNVSIKEVEDSGSAAAAQELAALYAEVLPHLDVANSVPYDPERDAYENSPSMSLHDIQMFRALCRSFEAESKAARERNDWALAVEYTTTILRLGGMLGRGGLFLHAIVGTALDGVGYQKLAEIRKQLPKPQQCEVMAALRRHLSEREPIKAILARDNDYSERVYGLSDRLSRALTNLHAANFSRHRLEDWVVDREMINMLLQTDLAIRLYKRDHQRLPKELGELVPGYLPAIPIDLYANRPLIYRVANGDFTLYSVGVDRKDNGGNFGRWPAYHNAIHSRQPGLDLSLDSIVEPEKRDN